MVDFPEIPEDDLEDEEVEEVEEAEEMAPVNELINVPIDRLRIHELSRSIYKVRKNSKEIKEMAEDMLRNGQLEPIVINPEFVIISGVIRYYAAMKLGWTELRAIVNDNYNKNKEVELIVSHNRQRKKKIWQIVNEVEAILGTLGKSQGQRRDLLQSDKSNPYGKIGQDRFEIAATILGDRKKATTLRRLIRVSDFEKEDPEHKKLGLLNKIHSEGLSISKAAGFVTEFKKKKEEREKAKKRLAKKKSLKLDKQPYKIFHKSCENMDDVEDGSIQVVFTSPPYWDLRNYGVGTAKNPELGHERTPQEFVRKLSGILREVRRVLNDRGSFFLNIGDTYRTGVNALIPPRLILNLCDNEGWFFINEIIWKKSVTTPQSSTRRLQSIYEKVFHLVKDPDNYFYQEFKNWKENDEIKLLKKPANRNTSSTESVQRGFMLSNPYDRFKDFIDEQNVRDIIFGSNASTRQRELKNLDFTKEHPALMPTYLPVIPILTTSKEGDTILDPFSGSGTTGKAALLLGRKYIGYELNPKNFELSIMDLDRTVETLDSSEQEVEIKPKEEFVIRTIGKKKYKVRRNPVPRRKGASRKNPKKDSNN